LERTSTHGVEPGGNFGWKADVSCGHFETAAVALKGA
jgi:hypothetical protein